MATTMETVGQVLIACDGRTDAIAAAVHQMMVTVEEAVPAMAYRWQQRVRHLEWDRRQLLARYEALLRAEKARHPALQQWRERYRADCLALYQRRRQP